MHFNTVSVETSTSTSTSTYHSDTVSKQNPLLSIISFIMAKIDEGQVDSALECIAKNSNDVIYQIVKNCENILQFLKPLYEQSINNPDSFSIECKRCRESFKLTLNLRFLALLPLCFTCQEDWIKSFHRKRNTN